MYYSLYDILLNLADDPRQYRTVNETPPLALIERPADWTTRLPHRAVTAFHL